MPMTREELIDWLVGDTFDTCRRDDRYMRSILQDYWSGMSDEELRVSYEDLGGAPDDYEETDDRAAPQTVVLRFMPQAWIRDDAVAVDPEHPDTWDVPLSLLLERFPTVQDWNDEASERDDMRLEGNAPAWVRNWSGPFEIELVDGQDPWPTGDGK